MWTDSSARSANSAGARQEPFVCLLCRTSQSVSRDNKDNDNKVVSEMSSAGSVGDAGQDVDNGHLGETLIFHLAGM